VTTRPNLRLAQGQATEVANDVVVRGPYAYTLCGWHTRSDIPLTVLTSTYGDELVDIVIQIAPGCSPIRKNGRRLILEHSRECSFIGIEDVADFEVRRGREVNVWPAPSAAQKDIEIFLFGPVWATLCHQQGLLPLHASAILVNGHIVAFAGNSGAGKSTIAALLGAFGYELVTDDILPISFDRNSIPGAWPYLRRLKLKEDSINRLALTSIELVSETLDKQKYFARPTYSADDRWSRLDRIYVLENSLTDSGSPIEQITGADAVRSLIDQTYHFNFVVGSGRFNDHLALCARLASKVDVYAVRIPPSDETRKNLGYLLREHMEVR
jgi:hypothetical protein